MTPVKPLLFIASLLFVAIQAGSGDLVSSAQNYFEGTVAINNVPHTISCSCQEALSVDPKFALSSWKSDAHACVVTSSTIRVERSGSAANAMTDEDISEYYGQPRVTKMVALAVGDGRNITPYSEMYCADSRWTSARPFTLGGDLGEILLVLNSFESTLEEAAALSSETIANVLAGWLSMLSKQSGLNDIPALTLCTDREALNNLAADVGFSSGIDLQQIPQSHRTVLLQAISSDTSYHGDVFWRCLLSSPETYQIRSELIKGFLTAYFTLLWAAAYPQNIGVHTHSNVATNGPGAILAVQEPEGCTNHAATISPTQQTLDTFFTAYIYNPRAASERREQLVNFIAPLVNGDATTTLPIAHHKAQTWTETCFSSTFPDIPIYTAQLQH